VTGGSGGLGEAIASALSDNGWTVFAASRSGRINSPKPGVHPIKLDVTDELAIVSALETMIAQTGRLDAVIANAGINVSAPFEELPPHRAREIMETNFWGVANVARAALPYMRAQRSGTILAVGSLAGLVSPPGEALYAASKHALEGFLEALRYEVHEFGIRILLAEPGFIRTRLAESESVPPSIPDYSRMRAALAAHWHTNIADGMPAEKAAAALVEMIENPPALRRRIGKDALWIPRLKQMLPARLFFSIVQKKFGINRSHGAQRVMQSPPI
jgi:NAD(P)-dependent dehydrogenase (short-subunit alcohol dehydrogenase family)